MPRGKRFFPLIGRQGDVLNLQHRRKHLFEVYTVGRGPSLLALITGIKRVNLGHGPFEEAICRGMNAVTERYGLPWQKYISWYLERNDGLHSIRTWTGADWIRAQGRRNYFREIAIMAQPLTAEQFEEIRRHLGKFFLTPKDDLAPHP